MPTTAATVVSTHPAWKGNFQRTHGIDRARPLPVANLPLLLRLALDRGQTPLLIPRVHPSPLPGQPLLTHHLFHHRATFPAKATKHQDHTGQHRMPHTTQLGRHLQKSSSTGFLACLAPLSRQTLRVLRKKRLRRVRPPLTCRSYLCVQACSSSASTGPAKRADIPTCSTCRARSSMCSRRRASCGWRRTKTIRLTSWAGSGNSTSSSCRRRTKTLRLAQITYLLAYELDETATCTEGAPAERISLPTHILTGQPARLLCCRSTSYVYLSSDCYQRRFIKRRRWLALFNGTTCALVWERILFV